MFGSGSWGPALGSTLDTTDTNTKTHSRTAKQPEAQLASIVARQETPTFCCCPISGIRNSTDFPGAFQRSHFGPGLGCSLDCSHWPVSPSSPRQHLQGVPSFHAKELKHQEKQPARGELSRLEKLNLGSKSVTCNFAA